MRLVITITLLLFSNAYSSCNPDDNNEGSGEVANVADEIEAKAVGSSKIMDGYENTRPNLKKGSLPTTMKNEENIANSKYLLILPLYCFKITSNFIHRPQFGRFRFYTWSYPRWI